MNTGKFISQALSQSIRSASIDPACISDKTNNTGIAYSVTCPTNSANIAIVKPILQRCLGARGVSIANLSIQFRVFNIRIIVIRAPLACGVWRITHNHSDIQLLLHLTALTVINQQLIYQILLFIHLEGVSQANTFERHIITADKPMVGRFDVDSCNIISQQHQLVSMYFVLILAR
ncbi:hypothetical protein D3C81_935280 [compost metagenome]